MALDVSRRFFLGGLVAALAAPAIIRPGVLMPVKRIILPTDLVGLQVETLHGGLRWLGAVPEDQVIDRVNDWMQKNTMATVRWTTAGIAGMNGEKPQEFRSGIIRAELPTMQGLVRARGLYQ